MPINIKPSPIRAVDTKTIAITRNVDSEKYKAFSVKERLDESIGVRSLDSKGDFEKLEESSDGPFEVDFDALVGGCLGREGPVGPVGRVGRSRRSCV